MAYTVLVDPKGDTTKREFVETVEDLRMANDLVTHITAHSPPDDKVMKQWGGRPYNVTHEFDRSRWVEAQHDWGGDTPTPGKPITIGWAIVGEPGPEIIIFPDGTTITPPITL